jgi:hypothetical protein
MRNQPKFRTAVVLAFLVAAIGAGAQTEAPTAAPQLIDRVVAVVNGDVILQSDVEEEVRFAAFQPFSDASTQAPMKAALERLIDRSLILQQMRNQPSQPQVTDQQLDKELAQIRLDIPACARYNCRTDAGWAEFCATQGFTPEEVRERRRTRMELLAFIEQRFRTGIRISQKEIEQYYSTDFVPKFKERNLNAPALDSVSGRIQEILLQQRVTALLSQWLDTLREQGSVQILDPSLASTTDATSPGTTAIAGGTDK